MNKIVRFKVNAAIKDMVGRGLIYDDNIAIIELIKNSKDAYSDSVEIEFTNHETLNVDSQLIIRDFGSGMSEEDIVNKWLNMAYSAKRGTRDKNNKVYAGNKGVGRFSCDRLGRQLILYTKTKESVPIKMYIDWEIFENKGQDDEISKIELSYDVITQEQFEKESGIKNNHSGTCLIIKNLRSIWTEKLIKYLERELEKFISDPNSTFKVYLDGTEIKNNIFDKLAFKTTHIKSQITEDGSTIQTTLFYQDNIIYKYEAKNIYETLKNIDVEIHFLDMFGKSYFKKQTGRSVIEYGSVLLFYNGYRISPYGNEGDDWLGINRRKLQGTRRFLGTRDIIGKVSINNDLDTFQVLTSREGLVHNRAYHELTSIDKDQMILLSNGKSVYGYVINLILQLENFIVNGADWDKLIEIDNEDRTNIISEKEIKDHPEKFTTKALSPELINTAVNRIYKRKDFEFINFEINKQTINTINEISKQKYQEYVEKVLGKIGNKKMKDLSVQEKASVKKVIEIEQDKTAKAEEDKAYAEEMWKVAEKDKLFAEKEVEIQKKTIEQITSENFFLRTTSEEDAELLLDNMHTISIAINTIENEKSDFIENNELTKEILEFLERIDEPIKKITSISKYAILKNFNDQENPIRADLITFIRKLLDEERTYPSNRLLKIINNLPTDVSLNLKFVPLKIMTLIYNIISNSKKAGAKSLVVDLYTENKRIIIHFEDYNSDGVSSKIKNLNDIFEKGVTATSGAGLGLYQVKKVVSELGGKIIAKAKSDGLILEIIFNETGI